MPGTPLTDAFIRVRLDDSDVPRQAQASGQKAGSEFAGQFDRKAAAGMGGGRFFADLTTEGRTAGDKAGAEFGDRFDRGVASGVKKTGDGMAKTLGPNATAAGKVTGDDFGKAFDREATQGIRSAGSGLKSKLAPEGTAAGRAAGEDFGKAFADEAVDTVDSEDLGGGIAGKLKVGMAAGGVLAGAALAAGFDEAVSREALSDKVGVQLGATGRQSARYGRIAGNLYAGAWGDSMEQVSDALAGVVSSVPGMRQATTGDLKTMTASVLDFAAAFDVDVGRSVQVAGQMIRTGLARDGRNAMDLLFATMQQVPAAVREDVLDAVDEYGPFFRTLGVTGQQAMNMLAAGADKGMYGIDKTGDAVKEFTIRATDMSEATKGAYGSLGLDTETITNQLLAGGDTARHAFNKIVTGLLSIKDPGERANTAIALFGTPMEDLAVNEIPSFLRGLRNTQDRLGNVAGTAKKAGNDLADNAAARFTSFKRTVQGDFVDFIGGTLLPAADDMWKEVGPDIRKFGHSLMNMGEDIGPVVKQTLPIFADALGGVADAIGGIARQFNKLPAPLQTALITGGLFALGGKKLGLLGGASAGAAASGAATGVAGGAAAAGGGVAAGTAAGTAAAGMTAGAALRAAGRRVVLPLAAVGMAQGPLDDFVQKHLDTSIGLGSSKQIEETTKDLKLLDSGLAHFTDTAFGWLPGKTGIEGATEEIGALDSRLTGLIKSGHAEEVQRSWNDLAAAAKEQGISVKRLRELMPDTTKALRNAAGAAGEQAKGTRDATRWSDNLAGLWRTALIPSAKDLADKFDLGDREARGLRRTIADSTGTAKQHENQLRQVADQLGLNKDQTHQLIREYGDIPPKVETDAKFNHRDAERDISGFTDFFNTALSNIKNEEVGIKLSAAARGAVRGVQNIVGGTVGLFDGKVFGGEIRGGIPGRDSVPIMAMGGEHMFTKSDVDKLGGQDAAYALRKMIQRGEFAKKGDLQYFRHGGAVEINTRLQETGTAAAMASVSGMFDTIGNQISESLSGRISQMLATGGGRPLGPGGSLSAGQIAVGQGFAKSQAGLPYQWGGTGNPSWDCSGFVGGTLLAALGQNPRQRIGTTASMPWAGWSPGVGSFTAGTDPGSHMAGNIGGLGIESRGGDGVTLGSGITPLTSFARLDHYDGGGKMRHGMAGINLSGADEAWLDPLESRGLKRLANQMTHGNTSKPQHLEGRLDIRNWQTGEAYFRGIARDEVDGADDFAARTERMG